MILENKEEYINCSGMGILTVEEKLKDFASRGNIGELTVESSDGGHWHSYFNIEDWKEFKDSVNTHAAITKVWIKEIPSRLAESSKTFRHPNVTLGTCDCGSKTKYTFRQRIERDGYSSKDAESMADFADEDLDNEMCLKCYTDIRDDWCQYTGRDKLKEAKENHTDLKEFLRKEADETELFDEKDILKFEKFATDSDWECLKDLKAKTENPEYDSSDCWAEIDQAVADIILYKGYKERNKKNKPYSNVYAGITHEDANRNVMISNSEIKEASNSSSCSKDPEDTYVVWCNDKSIDIFPFAKIKSKLIAAGKEVSKQIIAGKTYITVGEDIPHGYFEWDINDPDENTYAQQFIIDPINYYKEYVNDSFTDNDSSSGGAIFKLIGNKIKEICNGDLFLNFINNED